MTDEVTPVAPPPVPLPRLEPHQLAALATDLARAINNLETILAHYKLSEEQYKQLAELPLFKKILETTSQQWHSSLNTAERVKVESQATSEQLLPILFARAANDKEPLNHVVMAAQLIAKIGGLGERDDANRNPGERFSIHIDLGGDVKLMKTVESASAPAGDAPQLVIDVPQKAD